MTSVIVTTVIVSIMWVMAWWLNRRHWKRIDAIHDACECMAIQRRAVKMHHAVDTKIRAMDSRNPDSSQHKVKKEEEKESTEVNKAIN